MGNTATRVVKNTGYLYLRMGISMLISLYTTRIILLSLGAEDFGIFNVVGGAINMLGFFSAALADPTQRYLSYFEGRGDMDGVKRIFNVTMILNLALSVFVLFAFVVAGIWLFNGVLNISEERIWAAQIVYGSLVLSTAFSVMTAPYFAVMNAHENMRYYTFVGILESFLKLAIAFIVVYTSQDKLIIYGIFMAAVPLVSLSIMRVYCHKHYEECHFKPQTYWDYKLSKEILGFAGWSLVYSALSMVGLHGLGIVLNHFYGAALNAAQGIASQVNSQLMAFSQNLLKAVNPVITKKEGAGERHSMIVISVTTSKMSYYLLAVFSIPIFFEAQYILDLWLKEVPMYAVVFVQLQIIRNLLVQTTSTFSVAIAAEGRIKYFNILSGIMWILPLFFTYLLFKSGSSPEVMYYVTIAFMGVALNLVKIFYMHKNCGLEYSYFIKELFLPVLYVTIVQSIVTLIPVLLMPMGFYRLIVTLMASVIGCIFSIYYFGISNNEREAIKSMTFSFISKIQNKKEV